MKIFALYLFFSLMLIHAYGQDLKNTEWIKIKVNRLDGSKVIERREPEDASLQYYFTADSVLISTNREYANKVSYSVKDKILTIGSTARYTIDSISNMFLVTSQLPNNIKTPPNKLNQYCFINADYLYDYLQRNNSLQFEGDSLVICDNRFSPTYLGNFTDLLAKEFQTVVVKSVEGSFTILPDGSIRLVNIESNKNFTVKEINKLKTIFCSSSGSWVLPPSPNSLSFKMTFSLTFGSFFGQTSFFLLFGKSHINNLTPVETEEETKHFDRGARLFNNKRFEEAAGEFTKCIAIDSLDLQAYYNLADSYKKAGKKERACETWKKLKEMGQKNGEILYEQNCQ
jgi:tetratricopeptide (TPR) repeat protein